MTMGDPSRGTRECDVGRVNWMEAGGLIFGRGSLASAKVSDLPLDRPRFLQEIQSQERHFQRRDMRWASEYGPLSTFR